MNLQALLEEWVITKQGQSVFYMHHKCINYILDLLSLDAESLQSFNLPTSLKAALQKLGRGIFFAPYPRYSG